jgi:hypothetical protein
MNKAGRKLAAIDLTRERHDNITNMGAVKLTSNGCALVTIQILIDRESIDERSNGSAT